MTLPAQVQSKSKWPARRIHHSPTEDEEDGSDLARRNVGGPVSGHGGTISNDTDSTRLPRRQLPQPVEVSQVSSTRRKVDKSEETSAVQDGEMDSQSAPADTPRKARRFAPQMVESSHRSRRKTDKDRSIHERDRTDSVTGTQELAHHLRRQRPDLCPVPPDNTPVSSLEQIPTTSTMIAQPPESRFSSTNLADKANRRHSFRVPDLPAITSMAESEEDSDGGSSLATIIDPPSLQHQHAHALPHAKTTRKSHALRQHVEQTEVTGQNRRQPDYLLGLAATAAERQLLEQAMAAYPNEVFHEPVHHYAGEMEESDVEGTQISLITRDVRADLHEGDEEESASWTQRQRNRRRERRDSDSGMDMQEMQRHQSKLEEQRRAAWAAGIEPALPVANLAPGINAGTPIGSAAVTCGGDRASGLPSNHNDKSQGQGVKQVMLCYQRDNELKPMRRAAAPPMAGQDLVFPKSLSPRHTRLDVYQLPGARKMAAGDQSQKNSGLWTPGGGTSRETSQNGLWMGVNAASVQAKFNAQRTIPSGLVTPFGERSDPFGEADCDTPMLISRVNVGMSPGKQTPTAQSHLTVPRHGFSHPTLDVPEEAAWKVMTIEEEFDDYFTTQVYNYLSLGYPVLARQFDEELSHITRVPVEILRRDDYEDVETEADTDDEAVSSLGSTFRDRAPSNASHASGGSCSVFPDGLNINPSTTSTRTRLNQGSCASSSSPIKLRRPKGANAKGYVGAPEGTGQDVRGMREGACERWLALRKYIWEWARQHRANGRQKDSGVGSAAGLGAGAQVARNDDGNDLDDDGNENVRAGCTSCIDTATDRTRGDADVGIRIKDMAERQTSLSPAINPPVTAGSQAGAEAMDIVSSRRLWEAPGRKTSWGW